MLNPGHPQANRAVATPGEWVLLLPATPGTSRPGEAGPEVGSLDLWGRLACCETEGSSVAFSEPQQKPQGWLLPPSLLCPRGPGSPDCNEHTGSFASNVIVGAKELLLQEGHHTATQRFSGILHQAGCQCVQEELLDLFLLPLQLPHKRGYQATIDNALGSCRTGKGSSATPTCSGWQAGVRFLQS